MNRPPVTRPLLLVVVLLLCCTSSIAKTKIPKDRVKVEVYKNAIKLVHQNGYFAAPYKVKKGDTFASLSEKFYKTEDYTVALSEINHLSPNANLEPNSTILIASGSAVLLFGKGLEEQQYTTIYNFLNTVKDTSQLTCVFDGADISTEITHEGKWIITKYHSSLLRIFDPTEEKPELLLNYKMTPVLDIILSEPTYITSVSVRH